MEINREAAFLEALSKARHGDQSAWQLLLNRVNKYLLLVANRQVAEQLRTKVSPSDLVQETVFLAYQKFAEFYGNSEDDLQAWLVTILLNKVRTAREHYLGTKKRDLRKELSLEQIMEPEFLPSPSSIVAQNEQLTQLEQAISMLPDRYRIAVVMHSLQKKSFPEIGKELDCTDEAARKLWVRAIKLLKEILVTLG